MDDKIKDLIKRHEGLRLKMYTCPAGYNTIGYGFNLDANEITKEIAGILFDLSYNRVLEQIKSNDDLAFVQDLDGARRGVIVDMAFNLGIHGLLKFKRMIAALAAHDHETAAKEMEDSLWFHQVGNRAKNNIAIMRSGRL